MMKKVIMLLFILTLSGCWDKKEIEETAFVVAIGIDEYEKEDGVMVTFQIANPQVGIANTGGEKEAASEIITFPAPDFITARDLANASVARKIDFSHAKVIIIGEGLAKNQKFLDFLTSQIRDREIRRDLSIIVSKEKAANFINNNKPTLETRPHKFFDLMSGRWIDTGLVPLSDLQRFFQRVESKTDAYLAIYASTEKSDEIKYGQEDDYLPGQINQKGGSKTQLIGSALFDKGIMKGTLTGEETRLALNLRPKSIAKFMRATYPDPLKPEYRVSTLLTKHKRTKIKVITNEYPLKINISMPLDYEILAIPSGANYVTNTENQELLRKQIEESLEKKFQALIKRTQEEFKTNPFNWSHVARRNFLTMQEYEKYDFEKKYLNAEININVSVKFTGFGKQLAPLRYNETEEE